MSELYHKSWQKLELNMVLQQLSACAGSSDGKVACLALVPSSDLDEVQRLLDSGQMTQAQFNELGQMANRIMSGLR